jgi:hypothetical protein
MATIIFLRRGRRWAVANPFPVLAGVVAVYHWAIVVLYMSGRAVSAFPPFRAETPHAIVTSAAVPMFHGAAAVLLVAGLAFRGHWRMQAAAFSAGVCGGYVGILALSVASRTAKVSWGWPVTAAIPLAIAVFVVLGWGADDADSAG